MTDKQYNWKDALTPKGDDDDLRKQIEEEANIIIEDNWFCLGGTISISLKEDSKNVFILDDTSLGGYYFNKQQFGWIIRQLQKLHEMIDD